MSWLEVQPLNKQNYRVSIEPGARVRVGRSAENEIALLEDPAASRFHAEFAFDGDSCLVSDVGSTNGTFVDGQRLARPMTLLAGTWVRVGNAMIRLITGSEPLTPAPPTPAALSATEPPELAEGQSVMLSVSDVMDSMLADPSRVSSGDGETGAQIRAFTTLSRAANELLAQRPLDEVLELIVSLAFEIASPDRGAVMLLEGDPPRLRTGASRGMAGGEGAMAISRTIVDAVLNQQQAVMTSDALSDARFGEAESIILQNVRSAMCVPLWNNRDVSGLVYVDTLGGPQRFSRLDLEALTLVANVAAVKIDNVRLFVQEQRMKEIERELQAAAKIQRRLLPGDPPEVPGFEIRGYNNPCLEVGGDYYDHSLRNEDTLSIAIGDVSGKGMSAALLMASLQASLHAHISAPTLPPDIVSQLNRVVCRNSEADKFSTFFYGEIDVATGVLRYCNAGHHPPLILRAATGKVERLAIGGLILGFDPDIRYDAHEDRLEPGDLIVAYSDGVTESMNPASEEFGEERLIETIAAAANESVEATRRRIDGAVDEFVGQADPFDDYTVLLVRRAPTG